MRQLAKDVILQRVVTRFLPLSERVEHDMAKMGFCCASIGVHFFRLRQERFRSEADEAAMQALMALRSRVSAVKIGETRPAT